MRVSLRPGDTAGALKTRPTHMQHLAPTCGLSLTSGWQIFALFMKAWRIAAASAFLFNPSALLRARLRSSFVTHAQEKYDNAHALVRVGDGRSVLLLFGLHCDYARSCAPASTASSRETRNFAAWSAQGPTWVRHRPRPRFAPHRRRSSCRAAGVHPNEAARLTQPSMKMRNTRVSCVISRT